MTGFIGRILTIMITLTTIFSAPVTYANAPPSASGPAPAARYGDVVPGHTSPEGTRVLHEGSVDEMGRPRVWSYGGNDAEGQPRTRNGVLEKNGSLTWDGAYNSRKAGQQYPNYPEVKGRPIQPGRGLVPISQVQTQNTTGSGSAEVNSPGREYFPEMDPKYKPSRLQRTAKVTRAQLEWLKGELAKLTQGKPNVLVGSTSGAAPGTAPAEVAENARAPNYELPRGVAGFYIAMGLIAGVTLYTDYANNPAAWTSYINSSTDMMGLAQLAAFMAVAGGSYWAMSRATTKMFGDAAMFKGFVYRPVMVGSLAMAGVLTTVLMEVMSDPNTSKCLGFDQLKTGSFPYRDYKACDALWDRWSSNEHWNNMAVNQIVPMVTNIVVAGAMWQSTLVGSHWLLSRQALVVGLRSIRFGFFSQGTWYMKLIGATANVGVFLGAYYISDKIFGAGQWAKEKMLDDWSFSNDPHGASIRETETLLYKEWATLKANGFKDPSKYDKVCFDSSRKYGMFYNCEEPNRLTLDGLLSKYADFQSKWRKAKLTDTENSYKQWRLKSDEYFATMEVAHDFYGSVLEDPSKLNADFVTAFVKTQESTNSDSWKLMKGANTDGEWKYLATYKFTDFLVASMACGPEAEGYGQNANAGIFGKIGSLWTGYVTGNSSPGEVIENSTGWKINFHPPRLTHPLRQGEGNVCQTGGFTRTLPIESPHRVGPAMFPSSTEAGKYTNLFDHIRAELRPGVLGNLNNDKTNFQDWWDKNITPGSNAVDAQLRKDYEKLLSTKFLSALTEKSYRRCYPSPVRNTGLEKYLKQMSRSDDTCQSEGMDRLSHGILLGLRDEMRLYLAMVADLQMSNVSAIGNHVGLSSLPQKEKLVMDNANTLLALMDRLLDGAKMIETAKRLDLTAITKDWLRLSTAHKMSMLGPLLSLPKQTDPKLEAVRARLQDKVDEILKASEENRPRLRIELQGLQAEYDRVAKTIPRPQPSVFEQQKYLDGWAYRLNERIDATFLEAVTLYRILTLFEQP